MDLFYGKYRIDVHAMSPFSRHRHLRYYLVRLLIIEFDTHI